jgi:hypothetical protein
VTDIKTEFLVRNKDVNAGFSEGGGAKKHFFVVGLNADIYGVAVLCRKRLSDAFGMKYKRTLGDMLVLDELHETHLLEGRELSWSVDYMAGLNIFVSGEQDEEAERLLNKIGAELAQLLNDPKVYLEQYGPLKDLAARTRFFLRGRRRELS